MPEHERILELSVDKFSDGFYSVVEYKGQCFNVNAETWKGFFEGVMMIIQSSARRVIK